MNENFFMSKAVALAAKGKFNTKPGVNVGSIIVKNQKIIGQGYYEGYGGPAVAFVIALSNYLLILNDNGADVNPRLGIKFSFSSKSYRLGHEEIFIHHSISSLLH